MVENLEKDKNINQILVTSSTISSAKVFNKFNIIRSSTIKKEDDYINKSYNINFVEYSLVVTTKIYKNNSLEEKINNIYKCRKIKI